MPPSRQPIDPRTTGRSVTDNCPCGHQIIAHSATDGCVYCGCDERYRDEGRAYERLYDYYGPCWRCGVVMVLDEARLCLNCEKRSQQFEVVEAVHASCAAER